MTKIKALYDALMADNTNDNHNLFDLVVQILTENNIDLPVYQRLNTPNQVEVTNVTIGLVGIELHQDETDEWVVDFGHSHPVEKVLEAIAEAIALNTMLALSAKLSKDIAA